MDILIRKNLNQVFDKMDILYQFTYIIYSSIYY